MDLTLYAKRYRTCCLNGGRHEFQRCSVLHHCLWIVSHQTVMNSIFCTLGKLQRSHVVTWVTGGICQRTTIAREMAKHYFGFVFVSNLFRFLFDNPATSFEAHHNLVHMIMESRNEKSITRSSRDSATLQVKSKASLRPRIFGSSSNCSTFTASASRVAA